MNAVAVVNWTLWVLVIGSIVAAMAAVVGAMWSRRSYAPCHTPPWVDLTLIGSYIVGSLAGIAALVIA
jgi:hypothetical protein